MFVFDYTFLNAEPKDWKVRGSVEIHFNRTNLLLSKSN